jgi:aminopeptidase N
MQSDAYYPIKQYVVFQTQSLPFEERKVILETALATNNLFVRKAVAASLRLIPEAFKIHYETLLHDDSYETKEIALINLCQSFPENVEYYLEQMKGIEGNNDKSLKLTWLKLKLVNGQNSGNEQKQLLEELLKYASADYESSIRQNALEILLEVNFDNPKVIEALFLATNHHKWQFSKFAKEKIRTLLKQPDFRNQVEILVKTTDENKAALYLKFLKE